MFEMLNKKFGPIFKELLNFLLKKLSLSSQIYVFGIRDPEKTYSGSRGLKGTGSRIPDPYPQHCSEGGFAFWMNSAGRDSVVPNINFAEEMALSSCGTELRPRSIHGRWSGHTVLASQARKAAFNWPWHLSNMPLLCGW
jgi:hypothetical protein